MSTNENLLWKRTYSDGPDGSFDFTCRYHHGRGIHDESFGIITPGAKVAIEDLISGQFTTQVDEPSREIPLPFASLSRLVDQEDRG